MKTKKLSQNMVAISIGFFLIVGVALLTFFGSGSKKEKNASLKKTTASETAKLPGISSETLLRKISFSEHINIIDIRSAESFANEHILGASNYSLESIQKNADGFDKSAGYVIVDDLGLTPAAIATGNYLSEKGFESVAYLEGGLAGWKEKFNPTILLGSPYSFSDQSKVSYIKNEEIKTAVKSGENIFIIDMRNPAQFSANHFENSANIPFNDLENKRKSIPLGKKIIIVGENAVLSFQGAVKLFDMGFPDVYALSDNVNLP